MWVGIMLFIWDLIILLSILHLVYLIDHGCNPNTYIDVKSMFGLMCCSYIHTSIHIYSSKYIMKEIWNKRLYSNGNVGITKFNLKWPLYIKNLMQQYIQITFMKKHYESLKWHMCLYIEIKMSIMSSLGG
jgi:hypothetical protein